MKLFIPLVSCHAFSDDSIMWRWELPASHQPPSSSWDPQSSKSLLLNLQYCPSIYHNFHDQALLQNIRGTLFTLNILIPQQKCYITVIFLFFSKLQWTENSWVSAHQTTNHSSISIESTVHNTLSLKYCSFLLRSFHEMKWNVWIIMTHCEQNCATVGISYMNREQDNFCTTHLLIETQQVEAKEMQASTWILLDRISPTSWQHSCFLSASVVCQLE
jgi:hypothetical protein